MERFRKRIHLRIICVMICCLLLSACSSTTQTPATSAAATTTSITSQTTQKGTSPTTTGIEIEFKRYSVVRDWVLNPKKPILSEYPIKNAPKITYWTRLLAETARKSKSMNETRGSAYLTEKTGIPIEWIHPAMGTQNEAFNLLIAGGDLPDIIEHPWLTAYPAGPDAAIKAGLIYKLNDVMDKWAPDYKQKLELFPDLSKKTRTDIGTIWGFPFYRVDEEAKLYMGLMIRNDWLKDGGFAVPETISEWETVLTYFKEKKGAVAPYSVDGPGFLGSLGIGQFVGAYGTVKALYLQDGKVTFGPALPAYKDGLDLLRKWYTAGLIDPNIFTNKGADLDTNVYTGKTGAVHAAAGGGMGKFNPVLIGQKADSFLVGAKVPTLKKGEVAEFGHREDSFSVGYPVAVVTGKSKNAEYAVKLMNYMWSDVGVVQENFGIEGESYTRESDGYPKMLPFIANAADVKAEWGQFCRTVSQTPTIQCNPVNEQLNQTQRQLDAITLFKQTNQPVHIIPPLMPTLEESREYAKIYSSVDSYVTEFTSQYITGKVPESDFNNVYIPRLKTLQIDRMVELRELALARYNAK